MTKGKRQEFETVSPLTGRLVEVRAYPSAEGLSVSFRDVTARRRAESRDRFLVALDDATRALTDPEDITRTAARLLGTHLGVDRCAYADVQPGTDTFDVTGDFCQGVPSIVGRYTLASFGDEFARFSRAGTPFVVEDAETDPRTVAVREAHRQAGMRAVVSVSLLKAGKVAAGMAVHQKTPRRWEPDEIDLVEVGRQPLLGIIGAGTASRARWFERHGLQRAGREWNPPSRGRTPASADRRPLLQSR